MPIRFRLGTLLILLAILPPLLAYFGPPFVAWLSCQYRPQPQLQIIDGPMK